jgi:hypothetical protein
VIHSLSVKVLIGIDPEEFCGSLEGAAMLEVDRGSPQCGSHPPKEALVQATVEFRRRDEGSLRYLFSLQGRAQEKVVVNGWSFEHKEDLVALFVAWSPIDGEDLPDWNGQAQLLSQLTKDRSSRALAGFHVTTGEIPVAAPALPQQKHAA